MTRVTVAIVAVALINISGGIVEMTCWPWFAELAAEIA